MIPQVVDTVVADEAVSLFSRRALFWTRTRTLIIADPHFGKTSAFRAAGIPVPPGSTSADLTRLTELIADTKAERLLILGDLFHAKSGLSAALLKQIESWRRTHREIDIVLVRGNHDKHAGPPPGEWEFKVHTTSFSEAPFFFVHDGTSADEDGAKCDGGDAAAGLYTLCGHVHPAVRLYDAARSLKAPCFLFGKKSGLIPAFGSFTGTAVVRPHPGDQVFVLGPAGELLPISTRAA